MTSNRPLEDWGKLLSDVPTAGAPAPEGKKTKKPNEPSTAGAAS
jgi:hypothetical protein